jgi:outer membrane protein assembly factor BamB
MIRALLTFLAVVTASGCGPSAIHFMREGGPVADVPRITPAVEVDKLWRVDLGAGYSNHNFLLTPFVDSERVFAAEPGGRVAALDVQTGRIEWERNLKESLSAGVGVGEGLLIVATRDGEVVALERASGEQRWRVKMGAEILARPVVAAGVVILRSGDGQVIGVDSGSGEIRWRVRRSVPGLSVRGLSAPIEIEGVALIGFASGRLSGIEITTGKELWSVPIFRPRGSNEIDRLVDIDADPYRLSDSLYVAGFQSKISALSLATQTIRWESETSTLRALSSVGDQILVTADDGTVMALGSFSGQIKWSQAALQNRGVSGPLGISGLDLAVVGDFKGNLFLIDGESGELIGQEKGSGGAVLRLFAMPGEGRFLSLSENGSLTAWAVR